MFGVRKHAKRFTLLLLEEGEDYVADWVATCSWPATVPGNWQGLAELPGRLRLCSKSLFFDPDDVRVPIVRCCDVLRFGWLLMLLEQYLLNIASFICTSLPETRYRIHC
jgi:hypothetical protein